MLSQGYGGTGNSDDVTVVVEIRGGVSDLPTYGYRRMLAYAPFLRADGAAFSQCEAGLPRAA